MKALDPSQAKPGARLGRLFVLEEYQDGRVGGTQPGGVGQWVPHSHGFGDGMPRHWEHVAEGRVGKYVAQMRALEVDLEAGSVQVLHLWGE